MTVNHKVESSSLSGDGFIFIKIIIINLNKFLTTYKVYLYEQCQIRSKLELCSYLKENFYIYFKV